MNSAHLSADVSDHYHIFPNRGRLLGLGAGSLSSGWILIQMPGNNSLMI